MSFFSLFLVMASLLGACISLAILTYIDLKVRLLPNTYVLAFALFGLAFHLASGFVFASPVSMLMGMTTGGGLLYAVRFIANRAYNQDTLGLGDVKLMMAAGLWLGGQDVLSAIILGACAGVVHGLIIALIKWQKTGKSVDFGRLSLPAGPGFIIGILIAAVFKFM